MSKYGVLALQKYQSLADLINRQTWKDKITELSINGPNDVWARVAGKGYIKVTKSQLPSGENFDQKWLHHLCSLLAAGNGISWRDDMPLLACKTPDGHRLMAMCGPNIESGMALSIRVKRLSNANYDSFHVGDEEAIFRALNHHEGQKKGTHASTSRIQMTSHKIETATRVPPLCPAQWRERIDRAIDDGEAVMLSGGTGSGKTTLLNYLMKKIAPWKRVITAEDTREVEVFNENRLHLLISRTEGLTKITYGNLIDTVLRLNPDVFMLGEVSIANAFPLLQAWDTGHEGGLSTMHANTPFDALRGLRRRVSMGGGAAGEVGDIMEFLMEAIGLIIQVRHVPAMGEGDTERRVVTHVVEPKSLMDKKTVRDDFIGQEKAFDKIADVPKLADEISQELLSVEAAEKILREEIRL